MKEEPFFLLNEFLDEERKQLSDIIEISAKKDIKPYERAVFLRNFTNSLFKAYKKEKKPVIDKQRKELELKKKLLLEKLNHLTTKTVKKVPKELIKPKEETITNNSISKREILKISFDGHSYTISEPLLSEDEKTILKSVKDLNLDPNKQEFSSHLQIIAKKNNLELKPEYAENIKYYLIRDSKFGKLTALIEDSNVKEIICNSANKPVLVQYKETQDIPTNIDFESNESINDFIKQLAKKSDQKLSSENPFLNTVINKLKIQATLGSEFLKPKFVIAKT
jgi:hypothetical protein